MTKEEVFEECMNSRNGVILQEKNFKKKYEKFYNEIIIFVKDDMSFIQKLYNWFHGLEYVPLTQCGKKRVFRNFKYGYNDFCSANCKCMVEHSNKKRIETSIVRYGVTNPVKSENVKTKISKTKLAYSEEKKNEIADKKRKTLREHYGEDYGKVIEERNMKLFGVKNVSQIKEVSDKIKQSNVERYGGIGFASEEIREKIKLTKEKRYADKQYNNNEQRKQTCLERYGSEYYFKSEQFKQQYKNVCLEKYGVDNASKSEIIKQKISNKNKKTLSEKTMLKHPDIIEVNDDTFIVKCNDDCMCGGTFEIPKHIYFQRNAVGVDLCIAKNPIKQNTELENTFLNYIKNIYDGEIVVHNRKILSGKEIDIFLPELNIGFEFNGDYWHSNPMFSKYNDDNVSKHWKNDALKKYKANCLGISLYTVWEYEWLKKNEETRLYVLDIIKNKRKHLYEYYVLKQFIDSLDTAFNETEFGIFETNDVIIRYAEGFYCGKNTIDNNWFIKSEKRVIYVYDFEINDNRKFEIIKSLIRHAVNETPNKIYARNCTLQEIDNKTARPFLEENSLFGHRNATITYGLYYNDELVMIYSFGHNFYGKKKHIEVIRVCTKKNTIVIGGSSKCLKHYVKQHGEDIKKYGLVFYVDKIHQDGRSLEGFEFVRHNYGVMNYWNFDYDDGEIKGTRGTAFNRMPSKHQKIKELEKNHIITCVYTIGVDLYFYK